MTATVGSADAPFGKQTNWKSINWKQVRGAVRRLQVRIAKAVKGKKFRKARSLQWIITHSYYAKLLAIKRVTSNKGKRHKGKLMIKPARKGVKAFLRDTRKTIRKHLGMSTVSMIGQLNPKIRGWANYHRHVVSGKIFSYIDTCIYNSLWQWMKRRHRNKSKAWMKRKYWVNGSKPWMFSTRVKDKKGKWRLYEVIRACHIGIVRHIKIRGAANPFDPKYEAYFRKRRLKKISGQCARLAESFA